MSFQAYLDNIEKKTGKTPNESIAAARDKGFDQETKSGEIAAWLKEEYELGHAHAMALVHVIKMDLGLAISTSRQTVLIVMKAIRFD